MRTPLSEWVVSMVAIVTLFVRPVVLQASCDETYFLHTTGEVDYLTSPYYPSMYPPLQSCSYLILVEPGHRIRIAFDSFDLERGSGAVDCSYDRVQIYDGETEASPRLGTWCGQVPPPTILSTHSELLVQFTSDGSIQETGFSATVRMVNYSHVDQRPTPEGPPACHNDLPSYSGFFQSPGFPEIYDNDIDCVYVINPNNVYARAQLRFLSFDLEPSYSCIYDYVEVRDGPNPGAPVLGRYCGGPGNAPPDMIESRAGGSLYVIFHTDYSERFTGFRAEYIDASVGFPSVDDVGQRGTRFVCDGTIVTTAKAGLLVSHDDALSTPYPVNRQCNVTIRGDRQNERVFINVVDSDLSPQPAGQCGFIGDFLSIDTNPVTWLCGRDRGHFVIDSNRATLRFSSDALANPSANGFKVVYTVFYEDPFGCDEGYFMCSNGRCIIDEVVCDGVNHCGDESDEWSESCQGGTSYWWITVVIFLSSASPCCCLLLLVMNASKEKHRKNHQRNDTTVILSNVDTSMPPPPYSAPVTSLSTQAPYTTQASAPTQAPPQTQVPYPTQASPPTQAPLQGPQTISGTAVHPPPTATPRQGPSTISGGALPAAPHNLYHRHSNLAAPPAVQTAEPPNSNLFAMDFNRQSKKKTLPPL